MHSQQGSGLSHATGLPHRPAPSRAVARHNYQALAITCVGPNMRRLTHAPFPSAAVQRSSGLVNMCAAVWSARGQRPTSTKRASNKQAYAGMPLPPLYAACFICCMYHKLHVSYAACFIRCMFQILHVSYATCRLRRPRTPEGAATCVGPWQQRWPAARHWRRRCRHRPGRCRCQCIAAG